MISGHGSINASIMFIGDGCSDEDIVNGYCLTGQPERLFRSACHEHNINFNDTYRTCLLKQKINLSKPEKNRQLITDEYKNILTNEIKEINPRILVPTSELAFEFITGLKGIRKFRGSVLPTLTDPNKRTIPILGPFPYLNEEPKFEFITRHDFSKIHKNLQLPDGPIKEIGLCWVAKTANSLREFFKRHYATCIAKQVEDGGFLVIDIETYCGIPTCISFCFDGNESCTAPLLDRDISIDERMLMVHETAKLLALPIPKVNQNIKFDWKKLEQRTRIRVNNIVGDTLLAASCLYPEFPKNLGFLTSLYTDMPYFKDEGKQFDPSIHNRERLYIYCAKDSLSTHKIYTNQIKELKETGTEDVYKQLIKILPIYKTMEENGILIDETKRQELIAKYESLFDIQVFKFQKLTNSKANPLSDDQVRKIVFDELKYNKIRGVKTTKLGKPSTDEESLEILMWRGSYNSILDGKEILQTTINCRKLHKVLEYLVSPIHPDGRTRCEFNLAGAETGRTTTGKTTDGLLIFDKGKIKYKDLGRSFQNIGKHGFEVDGITLGKDIRSMFIPSQGFVFIEHDLSQAEARVDAVLAKDYEILEVFDGPIGIHRLTGSWIYDCDPMEIKKGILVDGKDRYHEAKTVRHACERNMKEDRLMMMIHRPIKECITILNKYIKNKRIFEKYFTERLEKLFSRLDH